VEAAIDGRKGGHAPILTEPVSVTESTRSQGPSSDAHTLLFASPAIPCGNQAVLVAIFAKPFATSEGIRISSSPRVRASNSTVVIPPGRE